MTSVRRVIPTWPEVGVENGRDMRSFMHSVKAFPAHLQAA